MLPPAHRLISLIGPPVVTCALLASLSSATTYIWIPVATRVEESDLIVIGRVTADSENQHKREGDCGPNEATLLVGEVLRGKLESPRIVRLPDGAQAQTIRLRHWETMSTETGNFSHIPLDERYKTEINGIWILQRSNAAGIYCISRPHALRLDELENVRSCIAALDQNYAGYKPGFPPDGQTWVSSWGGTESRTHADVCVNQDGTVFVEGSFHGELAVPGHPVLHAPSADHFLARLGADGAVRWAKVLGSEQRFDAKPVNGIGGACLLVGSNNQPCSVLGQQMPWTGGGPLIVCVSPHGKVKWTQTIDSRVFRSSDPGLFRSRPEPGRWGITNFVVVPYEAGYRIVGSFTIDIVSGERHVVAGKGSNWFYAAMDSSGDIRSIAQVTRGGQGDIARLAVGLGGRMMVGGSVKMPGKQRDVFVSAIAVDGNSLWTATEGKTQDDGLMDLAVDSRGTTVATMQILNEGYPSQQIFMCMWNPKGQRVWRVAEGGHDVEIGADGNIYCLGSYGQRFMVPKKNMPPSVGDSDLFVACYDRSGKRLWVLRDGGMSGEHAASLHLLPSNRAVVAGSFDGMSFLAGQVVKMRGLMDSFVMNIPLPKNP